MITGLLCFPATTMQAAPPFCQIRRSDGTSLPIGFRVLGLSPRGPRQLGVLAVHALRSKRTLLKRLPEMLATYEDGRQFVCPPSDGMYASVLCQGVWEPVESAAIRHVLRPGDSAVDVGANVGWHAIGMASIVGDSGMIWAVEPVPRTRDDLQRNVGRNPHLRVTVVPYALGASRGETSVHVETEPRLAPHGSAWLVVPRHQLGRVAGLDPSF